MGGQFQGMHHGIVLSTDESEDFWRRIDGCTNKPVITELPHRTKDGTTSTYKLWAGANGNDVAEYIVQGGGHCWPGGYQYFPVSVIGKTTYDFSASEAIWRFFSQHQRR
jgi:polyhydroxybutyrate depolymerase